MNQTIYIIIFSLLLRPIFPFVEYVANYHYISTELCVNKDKPKLKCDGKCHLKSELAKAATTDDSTGTKTKSSLTDVTFFFQEITELTFDNPVPFKTTRQLPYLDLYTSLFSGLSFHPPTTTV